MRRRRRRGVSRRSPPAPAAPAPNVPAPVTSTAWLTPAARHSIRRTARRTASIVRARSRRERRWALFEAGAVGTGRDPAIALMGRAQLDQPGVDLFVVAATQQNQVGHVGGPGRPGLDVVGLAP